MSLPTIPPRGVPSWGKSSMTSAGRITKYSAHFGGARVHFAQGGTSPEVVFSHGYDGEGAEIARCDLVDGETVYAPEAVECPNGIYMHVLGAPRRFEVEVFSA